MTIIEALSCELLVISFNCPYGPQELITNNKDAFLIEPNYTIALAEKISWLIENERIRNTMGIKARESSRQYKLM